MNMAGEESADPAKRPIASDVGDDRGMPNADVLPRLNATPAASP